MVLVLVDFSVWICDVSDQQFTLDERDFDNMAKRK